MTDKLIIAFDPGKITGVAGGIFGDDRPLELVTVEAITYHDFVYNDNFEALYNQENEDIDYIVSEMFESRDNGFAPDLLGVRVEGMIHVSRPDTVWRSPSKKSQVPDEVLKEHGFWQTGGDVDWEDGRDVNDAINHMLGFVAFDLKHRPTLNAYFRKVN